MARGRGTRNMGGAGAQSDARYSQASSRTELPVNTSDDEDVSPRKRQRVSKACDRCRQSKLKCNGATPRCGACVKNQKSCSYGVTSKRRGLRPGYVRALECLLGITFQAIRGSQDTVETLIQQTSRKSFWARDDTRDGSEAAGSPLETWKSSKVPRALDNLLAAPDELNDETPLVLPRELQLKLRARTGGATDPIQYLTQPSECENVPETMCAGCRIQASNQERRGMSTGYNDRDYSAHNLSVLNLQAGQIDSSCHALPKLPENPLQLLDRYFAFTHSWFPVVDKSAVQKSLFTYRNVLTGNRSMDCKHGDMALLWAVFAYADYQLRPRRNSSLGFSIQEIEDFVKYKKPSQRDGNPSVQHLQALLIIGLLHYSWQNWNNARLVTGEALAIGEHLGLDISEMSMSKCDRLTWLGCFLLDTITAAHVGKVPWISSRRIRGLLYVDDTGSDEWEPWRLKEALVPGTDASLAELLSPIHSITVFMKLMELICIQNDLIRFPANSKETHVQALLAWNKQLPEHIKSCLDAHLISTIQPPNILNLDIFQATIIASLSSSNILRNHRIDQKWETVNQKLTFFLRRFLQYAIPPTFRIVETILIRQQNNRHFSAMISQLDFGPHDQAQGNEEPLFQSRGRDTPHNEEQASQQSLLYTGLTDKETGPVPEEGPSLQSRGLDWSHMTAHSAVPTQTDPLALISPSSSTLPDQPHNTNTTNDFSIDDALGYLSNWDDIELPDPNEFRRNLGFMLHQQPP